MLDLREAREQALAELRSQPVELAAGDELMIVDDDTLEREWGYVFFYDSRRFRETGLARYRVAGNGPMIVNRFDGTVHPRGADRPSEYYITAYDTEFRRNETGWVLVLRDIPFDDVDARRALIAELDLSYPEIQELCGRLPAVVMTGPRQQVSRVGQVLRNGGIHAEILKDQPA